LTSDGSATERPPKIDEGAFCRSRDHAHQCASTTGSATKMEETDLSDPRMALTE
jgi:hypothetical protein